ncbi:MAG TPA: Ig-like domain-containing protein, partial [Geobacteraceae bacterium]|nr:Ig-like domain-containing protein [Geobacteraceae bacterium]
SGAVSYDAPTLTATFMPSAPLAPDTVYTATIGTGVKDLEGNGLTVPVGWSFTTAAVPPVVISTVPSPDATGVAATANVSALFSEAVAAATVTGATFTLSSGSGPVAGVVTYDTGTLIALFTPAAPLAVKTTYTATITNGVTNLSGTPMAASYQWIFTTACPVSMGGACYPSIAAAYAVAQDGSVLRAMAGLPAVETLSFSRGISVDLEGGYDAVFSSVIGTTVLGPLTVVSGPLTVGNLTIQ